MSEGEQPTALRLTIDTVRPVLVNDAAKIFAQISNSFDQHLKRIGTRKSVSLRLGRLYTGSLIADFLVFAGAVVTLNEFRDLTISYIERLSLVLQAIRRGAGFPLYAALSPFFSA
jgi:hypothetical protein